MANNIQPLQKFGIKQSTAEKYVGQKYGMLTVLSLSHRTSWSHLYATCQCDCGAVKIVELWSAKSGEVRSCGCLVHGPSHNRKPAGEAALSRLIRKYEFLAIKRGLIYDLTREQFRELIFQNCFYCDAPPSQKGGSDYRYDYGHIIVNGIDRVDNALGYTLDNCVACCKRCNTKKGPITKEMIYKLYHRLF